MTCPFDALTVKDCLSRRRIEFRRQRATWERFACENCAVGRKNEDEEAAKREETEHNPTRLSTVEFNNRRAYLKCNRCGKEYDNPSRNSICAPCQRKKRNGERFATAP